MRKTRLLRNDSNGLIAVLLVPVLVALTSVTAAAASKADPNGRVAGASLARYTIGLVGSDRDLCSGIVAGVDGTAYIVGSTRSTDFPTTPGAFDGQHSGEQDVFVSKVSANGEIEFSTLIGGADSDVASCVALGPDGCVYVAGLTYSPDFPVTAGALELEYSGMGDAFVAKLSPDGSSLLYSTFVGGAEFEEGIGLTVDSSGVLTLAGPTSSSDFRTTEGAYDRSYNGNVDGFVLRFASADSRVLYSTFLGGPASDAIYDVDVDASGAAYVTGPTLQTGFPTTPGAFDSTVNPAGETDAFVTKLRPDGSGLDYSSFLGGSGTDIGIAIAVDDAGGAYVTGLSVSPDYPVSPTAFDSEFNESGHGEAFVTKFSAGGASLEYSTFLGGSSGEIGRDIELDPNGLVCLTGETSSSDFPTTADAVATPSGGLSDAFVCTIDVEQSRITYSTGIGTDNVSEYGQGVCVDSGGTIHLAGDTFGGNFPADLGVPDDVGSSFAVALPPLSVASCSPNAGNRGSTLNVAIEGSRFSPESTVDFGPKIVVKSLEVVSSERIVARIKIKKKAARGLRSIVVSSPLGTTTGTDCFRVQ